jgi:hypothetical protein
MPPCILGAAGRPEKNTGLMSSSPEPYQYRQGMFSKAEGSSVAMRHADSFLQKELHHCILQDSLNPDKFPTNK